MTENHFRSHFSAFQINTQLFLNSFVKMAAGAHFGSSIWVILDDRKSRNCYILIFTKWLPAAILDDRKSLSIAFLSISDQYATFF